MNENQKSTRGAEQGTNHSIVYTVDSFANGIAFGQHRTVDGDAARDHYTLDLFESDDVKPLRSRYALNTRQPLAELERQLWRLSTQGVLRTAEIYFGTTTDPFFPFDSKFDATMRFLQLFLKYTPGLLVVQTRSPLVVLAMPVLRKLGQHTAVTMGVETPLEEMVDRYTPGLPRVEERLKAVRTLKNFNVPVTIQVSPVLPYGNWKEDAPAFAQLLTQHTDSVLIKPLYDGSERSERRMKSCPVAKRLADDRRFHYLRPDAAEPLRAALQTLAPQTLAVTEKAHKKPRQKSLFAA